MVALDESGMTLPSTVIPSDVICEVVMGERRVDREGIVYFVFPVVHFLDRYDTNLLSSKSSKNLL